MNLCNTQFKRNPNDDEMPEFGNCTSAIRYLLKKSSGKILPRVWIGDMPRTLMSRGWTLRQITASELKEGDLLFLKSRQHPYKISHIMIAITVNSLFHCTSFRKKGCIEKISEPVDAYGSALLSRAVSEPRLMLSYIDARNVRLREQYQSEFIPLPI